MCDRRLISAFTRSWTDFICIRLRIENTKVLKTVRGPWKRGSEIRDSNLKIDCMGIQDSDHQTGQDSGFKFHIIRTRIQISKGFSGIHFLERGWIQESNYLNPRKQAGIQDSNLVFQGPTKCHE